MLDTIFTILLVIMLILMIINFTIMIITEIKLYKQNKLINKKMIESLDKQIASVDARIKSIKEQED